MIANDNRPQPYHAHVDPVCGKLFSRRVGRRIGECGAAKVQESHCTVHAAANHRMPLSSKLDRKLRAAEESSDEEEYYEVTDRSSSPSVIDTGEGGALLGSDDEEEDQDSSEEELVRTVTALP